MRATLVGMLVLFLGAATAAGQEPCAGETLVSPMSIHNTYLVDLDLNVVKTWHCSDVPAFVAYLLDDGSIVRPCRDPGGDFMGGGAGGRIQRYDADDQLIWDYYFSTPDYQQHHDVEPMPNGNLLVIAWERKSREEAIEAGRQNVWGEMWPTMIAEIEPVGATGGNIVWEWHAWDHLIQDADPSKQNYGVVGDHPELIDINLGGVATGDWIHANAIDYNPQLDQIVISSHFLHEIYVIDHSTTTAEAAGHSGGNAGMGGDILYRWGRPENYRAGGERVIYVVHGVNWVEEGYPGAGNILLFNNGDRPGFSNDYSSVEEITPPLDGYTYYREPGAPFGPQEPTWIYVEPASFYANHLSGAYRLANGNTLITEGTSGHIFEVTAAGDVVWDYDISTQLARAPRFNMETTAAPPAGSAPVRCGSQLLRNYPDPFNPSTRIPFELDRTGEARVDVFDLQGRQVRLLTDRTYPSGRHEVEWDGRDAEGRGVASGLYVVRLSVAGLEKTERLILLR
jgi:hypothetical protein